jgi:hypothetical protein
MDISDMVGGKHVPEGNDPLDKTTDFMNLRKLQPKDSLKEKLLSAQASHAAVDNLIRGLVDLLPKPEGIWPLDDRAKWLRLAAGIFDLGYKAGDGEQRGISIAVVKPGAANRPNSPLGL